MAFSLGVGLDGYGVMRLSGDSISLLANAKQRK
ncbi:hypothetical protein VINE108274_14585 [Vibrio neptunius]